MVTPELRVQSTVGKRHFGEKTGIIRSANVFWFFTVSKHWFHSVSSVRTHTTKELLRRFEYWLPYSSKFLSYKVWGWLSAHLGKGLANRPMEFVYTEGFLQQWDDLIKDYILLLNFILWSRVSLCDMSWSGTWDAAYGGFELPTAWLSGMMGYR